MDRKEALNIVQESGYELENLPDKFKKVDKKINFIKISQKFFLTKC